MVQVAGWALESVCKLHVFVYKQMNIRCCIKANLPFAETKILKSPFSCDRSSICSPIQDSLLAGIARVIQCVGVRAGKGKYIFNNLPVHMYQKLHIAGYSEDGGIKISGYHLDM